MRLSHQLTPEEEAELKKAEEKVKARLKEEQEKRLGSMLAHIRMKNIELKVMDAGLGSRV